MNTFHSYEEWGASTRSQGTPVLEAYSGEAIVGWYNTIDTQVTRYIEDESARRNFEYADKLREFRKTWRNNPISGSINREDIEVLKAGADQLAVDSWGMDSYFQGLRMSLAKLIASEEELPRGMDMNANDPFGGGSPGRPGPPLSPDFGPEDEAPGDTDVDFEKMDEDPSEDVEQEPKQV